ncbi:MAG TPA: DUF2147 domain-containing protein [Burkholderiales bacterium]|jgi:uncharacterized protein (DUF2147 family)
MRLSLARSRLYLNTGTAFLRLFACIVLSCVSLAAHAQGMVVQNTPAGLWRTIDDNTGKPSALVRIVEAGGEYIGRVEKIFPGISDDPNPTCDDCEGARKSQPVLGMTILWGMHRSRDQAGEEYSGGEILDPQNGHIYHCLMTMADGGKKLRVRGYYLVTLFGRTQVWEREE